MPGWTSSSAQPRPARHKLTRRPKEGEAELAFAIGGSGAPRDVSYYYCAVLQKNIKEKAPIPHSTAKPFTLTFEVADIATKRVVFHCPERPND
jgi:hypothetical protein